VTDGGVAAVKMSYPHDTMLGMTLHPVAALRSAPRSLALAAMLTKGSSS
jgi:hypothetical protein